MKRLVLIDVERVYELISSAEDVGCQEYVPDLISLIRGIRPDEIEEYARLVESTDGYTEEDYVIIKEKLTEYLYEYNKNGGY